MKILATSDLHQMNNKWKLLISAVEKEKVDVVAIAGDIFPKDAGIQKQMSFIPHFRKYLERLAELNTKVVLNLGNDDNQLIIPLMYTLHNDGLCYYKPEDVAIVNDIEFASMPYVPDYPFGYKFWCRAESKNNLRIDPKQYCEPLIIDKTNKFVIIENYQSYLYNQKSIEESLEETASKVKNIQKSIWLIHAPPAHMNLDVCAHGAKVGSQAVYDFIMKYQPMITIHGHIHESPEYNGHKYFHKEGNTYCIQGGQVTARLFYTIIDLDNGVSLKHSYYDSI